jgi:hypothetical protein
MDVTLDLVGADSKRGITLILFVHGPWESDTDQNLRVVQDRLYDYLEAIVGGDLEVQFPSIENTTRTIRVECRSTPCGLVPEFVRNFEEGIWGAPQWSEAILDSPCGRNLNFVVNETDCIPS